jgi:alkylhydroperoxidase/carboxymuconolactone decarboxylase family protein YurZ
VVTAPEHANESPIEHFQRTLGKVPEVIAVLAEHAPEFLRGYVDLRQSIMADKPGGLDLATKELVFVLLDVVYDNESGALNHLDAALEAGLTRQALLDALLQTLVVGGIQTWGKTGHRVFVEALKRTGAAAAVD